MVKSNQLKIDTEQLNVDKLNKESNKLDVEYIDRYKIPDDGTAAAGGGEQGAFIRSAPHAISGDNPLQVEADILFRNMKIQIKDSEPFYP